MKIAIMGSGGLGSYIGGRLVEAGHNVTFIARGENLRVLRNEGLQVKSTHGDFNLASIKATDDCADVGPVDIVILAVKTYSLPGAAEQMKPLVGDETVIVPVLNGVNHVDQLGAIFGTGRVLGGAASITAHRHSPGVIEQFGNHHLLAFGEMAGGESERCTAIVHQLTGVNIDFQAVPDIVVKMWRKYMAICAFAGGCSVVRGDKGVLWSEPETKQLFVNVTHEVVAVAQARQIGLCPSAIDELVKMADAAPDNLEPSMYVDLAAGRPMELEALNGTISRIGKELGVPTPANDFIYASLKPYANGAWQSR